MPSKAKPNIKKLKKMVLHDVGKFSYSPGHKRLHEEEKRLGIKHKNRPFTVSALAFKSTDFSLGLSQHSSQEGAQPPHERVL